MLHWTKYISDNLHLRNPRRLPPEYTLRSLPANFERNYLLLTIQVAFQRESQNREVHRRR